MTKRLRARGHTYETRSQMHMAIRVTPAVPKLRQAMMLM